MLKKIVSVVFVSYFYIISSSVLVFGYDTVPDIITMNTNEYKNHSKGLVLFNHGSHSNDFGFNCDKCHHDSEGLPIKGLQKGDHVDRCITCHKETEKNHDDKKLPKKEMIKKYHKSAIHATCKKCHKITNKERGLKKGADGAAPENCKECHPPLKK